MLQKYSSRNEGYTEAAASHYPYTYARTSVMKAALLKKQDYLKLLKMDISEATQFLESTQYKREIDELAVNFKGIELIETALNRNLSNTSIKLRRISPEKLRKLLDTYLARRDIYNIKTILRAKYTNNEKNIQQLLQPYMITQEKLNNLIKKQTPEEVLKDSGMLTPTELKKAIEKLKETKMLVDIENILDQHYYGMMLQVAAGLNSRVTLFKNFLETEIDIINIINIFRFKREGMDKKDIKKHLIPTKKQLIKKLAESSQDDLSGILESSSYGEISKRGLAEYKQNNTLIYLEIDLYKHLLKQALQLSGKRPLKADAILGYMFAKEIEVRNLKLLFKAKQLGLPQTFIEEQIIN